MVITSCLSCSESDSKARFPCETKSAARISLESFLRSARLPWRHFDCEETSDSSALPLIDVRLSFLLNIILWSVVHASSQIRGFLSKQVF